MESRLQLNLLASALLAVAAVEGALLWAASVRVVSPMVLLGVARLVEIGLMGHFVALAPGGWAALGLGRLDWLPEARMGLYWSVVFGLLATGGLGFFWLIGQDPRPWLRAPLPLGGTDLALYFLVGALISPLAEEMLFRGFIYGFLRRWGVAVAVILSTAFFVLAHRPWDRMPYNQVIGGVVFALAREKSHGPVAPAVIHVLGNSALFGLAWFIRGS